QEIPRQQQLPRDQQQGEYPPQVMRRNGLEHDGFHGVITPLSHSWERGWKRGHQRRESPFFDNLPNTLQHTLRLIQYFVIPKAQHDETLRCQPLVTSLIISNIITVLSA